MLPRHEAPLFCHSFAAAKDKICFINTSRRYAPLFSLSFLDVYGLKVSKVFIFDVLGFSMKLRCRYLATFSKSLAKFYPVFWSHCMISFQVSTSFEQMHSKFFFSFISAKLHLYTEGAVPFDLRDISSNASKSTNLV